VHGQAKTSSVFLKRVTACVELLLSRNARNRVSNFGFSSTVATSQNTLNFFDELKQRVRVHQLACIDLVSPQSGMQALSPTHGVNIVVGYFTRNSRMITNSP